jgi:hypothetical protein
VLLPPSPCRLRAGSATPGSAHLAGLGGDLDSEQHRALQQGLLRTGSRATSQTDTTDRSSLLHTHNNPLMARWAG